MNYKVRKSKMGSLVRNTVNPGMEQINLSSAHGTPVNQKAYREGNSWRVLEMVDVCPWNRWVLGKKDQPSLGDEQRVLNLELETSKIIR